MVSYFRLHGSLATNKAGAVEATCYGRTMTQHSTILNTRAYIAAEPVRVNQFVFREDAVARDNQCVRALEEALAHREKDLTQALLTLPG